MCAGRTKVDRYRVRAVLKTAVVPSSSEIAKGSMEVSHPAVKVVFPEENCWGVGVPEVLFSMKWPRIFAKSSELFIRIISGKSLFQIRPVLQFRAFFNLKICVSRGEMVCFR